MNWDAVSLQNIEQNSLLTESVATFKHDFTHVLQLVIECTTFPYLSWDFYIYARCLIVGERVNADIEFFHSEDIGAVIGSVSCTIFLTGFLFSVIGWPKSVAK